MTEKQLKDALASIGKSPFVKHLAMFMDMSISRADAIHRLQALEGHTLKSCRTKVDKSRWIIRNDATRLAMEHIVDSAIVERRYPDEWRAAKDWLASN